MYDDGNYEETMRYCQEAAEYGVSHAMVELGELYMLGEGGEKN